MKKAWTKREIAILRRYYPEYGALALTKVLKGRTRNAIVNKAIELGIKSDRAEVCHNLKRVTL